MFELTEDHIRGMFHLANFEVPTDEMVFFGLRGCSPVAQQGVMSNRHTMVEKGTDFRHQRCTIGQWIPGEGFAVFAGSTVPNISGIAKYMSNNGNGVNMLAPCYLTDLPDSSDHRYQKGDHGLKSALGPHRAFRNANKLPVWRTGDDTDYEGNDRLVYETAYDNLHCSRYMDHTAPGYSSLGCQVVAGIAGRRSSNPGGEKGPWKAFVDAAYALPQQQFRYALFNEGEASRTVALGTNGRSPSIRFGSTGELAKQVQQGLIEAGHFIGSVGADGVIGFQTLNAIRDVQLEAFGPTGVDLVVGPATAAEIGLSWPGAGGVTTVPTDSRGGLGALSFDPDDEEDDGGAAQTAEFDPPIRKETRPNGKLRWVFNDPEDGTRRYIGTEARISGSKFKGLARVRGFTSEKAPIYGYKVWANEFDHWAAFIEPTAMGESQGSFSCVNSYDRAAFTFGFFQFAAHTPDANLIVLFRKLLDLPDAEHYFPDLSLVGGRVHQITAFGTTSLEGAQDRLDGNSRPGEQGGFMTYLNTNMTSVDDAELKAASRLIQWACRSQDHRLAQVELAIEAAKSKVAIAAQKVSQKGATLDGAPMPVCAMVMDILHQGRGTYTRIATALNAADQMHALRQVGRTAGYAARIDLVATKASSLLGSGTLGKLRYDVGAKDFA
ncbi:peptidoglycan-binding protein [Leisingera sp. M658]|uniref:peptidoglycan-binding domain-containing protein n=1 Tax=Leisingera sp. M658 TaxID=2867015 RepID=UPI0021A6E897|nr:peptidoglycan-binding domain-containing protein [Leisingera sp. M658]UWQ74404.1 peptidoglycan-binding protein [Leisingera sp. M658]